MRYAYEKGVAIQVVDHNITPLIHSSPRFENNGLLSEQITEVFPLCRYEQPGPGTSLKMDNHLKCGLVDHNLCKVTVDKPGRMAPILTKGTLDLHTQM